MLRWLCPVSMYCAEGEFVNKSPWGAYWYIHLFANILWVLHSRGEELMSCVQFIATARRWEGLIKDYFVMNELRVCFCLF